VKKNAISRPFSKKFHFFEKLLGNSYLYQNTSFSLIYSIEFIIFKVILLLLFAHFILNEGNIK